MAHAVVLADIGVEVALFTSPRRGQRKVEFSYPGITIQALPTSHDSRIVRRAALAAQIAQVSFYRASGPSPLLEIA